VAERALIRHDPILPWGTDPRAYLDSISQ
jgi:hypothetical protein